ncbi:MAG: hypothetical protein R2939_14635 [Kofleriaceae bacterium]
MASALAAGCGGAPDAGPRPDGGTGLCTADEVHAGFAFESYASSTTITFGGGYQDAPYPRSEEVAATAGACRYVRPLPAFCDPACDGSAACVDGACRPYPQGVAAGTLHTTGTHPLLTLSPYTVGAYYTMMATPGLTVPGEIVGFTLDGEVAAPLAMETVAIGPLTLPTDQVTATEGQPLTIAWTPEAGAPAATELVVHLDNDHHGLDSYVECVAADADGELTIPSSVLDRLIADGETGIGTYIENAYAQRRSLVRARTAYGCAELASVSSVFLSVETVRAP